MAEKVDLKKSLLGYRAKHEEFALLELPERRYLMIDGCGDPNTSPAYAQALQALYPVAYKLKFFSKRELGRDYVVMPLEGLWWAKDMTSFTEHRNKSLWHWTMMIMVPDWVEQSMFESIKEDLGQKDPPIDLAKVRFEIFVEGLCVQTLHIGPYDDESQTLRRLHQEFIPAHALELTGKHHEIYLSDPRRVPAEKLRTILRQPVQSIDG
ncbi:GyrI-like domain-containing protein [Glutamicibacter sp.]|uniref:GyrI-like domain-containing protein n=1 Tax=Glutamicibacter sp. TaxID=1931995 RepID=UPI002B49F9A4|nr:GyrI-like domain-containing protein [Glutamicibacter sp.]HJX79665.1 GyrI-like domain-containing protein [Glutamicibacter sp.]